MNRRPSPNSARKMKRRQLVSRIRELNREIEQQLRQFPAIIDTRRIEPIVVEYIFSDSLRGHDRDVMAAVAERKAGEKLAREVLDRRYVQVLPIESMGSTGFRYILRVVDPRSI